MDRRIPIAAFLLGAILGVLGTWLALDRRASEPPAGEAAATTAGAAPSASGPAEAAGLAAPDTTGPRPARAAAPSREAPAAPASADAGRDGAPAGEPVIEVRVTPAPGIPEDWSGTAYALPAGAAGAENEHGVAHVPVRLGAAARLKVPLPGRYDVGVIWPGAAVMVPDVVVDVGAPARADLVLPASAPVVVSADGASPNGAGAGKVGGQVRFAPRGEGTARTFPGRRERPRTGASVEIEDLSSSASSPPLPLSSDFDVRADVYQLVELKFGDFTGAMQMSREEERLVPTPGVVRGGGEVRLARQALAGWNVRFRLEPSPWPAPALVLGLRWSLPGGGEPSLENRSAEGTPPTGVPAASRWGPAGPARLAWSGPGVAPGEATATLVEGRATETEVVVRYDARGGEGSDLALDASALPDDAAPVLAVGWGGNLRSGGDAAAEAGFARPQGVPAGPGVTLWEVKGRRQPLGPDARGAAGLMVAAGPWVSRPVAPPAAGDWRPVVERGGDVAVVADPTPDPSLGSLFVRRADGAPLCTTSADDGSRSWAFETRVLPGTTLGPLPPGDVTLEARLGSVPLAPATLRVRAGRVTTWEVRWRDR